MVDSNLLKSKNIDSFINQLELSFNKISLIILYNLDKKNTKIISKLQSKNYNLKNFYLIFILLKIKVRVFQIFIPIQILLTYFCYS